jgi:hypothetical protein
MTVSLAQVELSSEGIEDWLAAASPAMAGLARWMDSKEDWVQPIDDELLSMLAQLVERVEDQSFVIELEGELSAPLGHILAIVHSSRFFRMIEMFERRSPGLASRLVFVLARLGGGAKVFSDLACERLMVVHQNDLLTVIASPRRCNAIAKALRLVRGES